MFENKEPTNKAIKATVKLNTINLLINAFLDLSTCFSSLSSSIYFPLIIELIIAITPIAIKGIYPIEVIELASDSHNF